MRTLIRAAIPVLLAMASPSAAGSETAVGPTPNALFQFQKDNQSHPWLRITTDSGRVERKVRLIDPIGLHDMTTHDRVKIPGPLEWNRIQRIDEVVTRARPWGIAGGVTLGLLGAGLGNALGAPDQQGGKLALAGLVVFGSAGRYIGRTYGSRFRSERNWYVADTTQHGEPTVSAEAPVLAPAPASATATTPKQDAAILDVCTYLDRNKLFRATGSFGSFEGYADVAGPGGLESLRERERLRDDGPPAPQRITWDDIDRVEVRGGSAMRGAVIGGAYFAVFGAVIGAAAVAASSSASVTVGEGALGGALYVAPVGIGLGALTGATIRRWVTVYPRH